MKCFLLSLNYKASLQHSVRENVLMVQLRRVHNFYAFANQNAEDFSVKRPNTFTFQRTGTGGLRLT